jgi:Cys-rich repeat protein
MTYVLRALAFIALCNLASTGIARADSVGSGTFLVNLVLDGNGGASLTGTMTFSDTTYTPFQVPVNLGTAVGSASMNGQVDLSTLPQGTFTFHATSASSGALDFDAGSDFLCSVDGCLARVSFVGGLSNVVGTALAGLPAGVQYTIDGTAVPVSMPGGLHYQADFGVNAFAPASTPAGTNVGVSVGTSFFYSPLHQVLPLQVDVTYADVSSAGSTLVTLSSNVAGTISSSFALGAFGAPVVYVDVSTTAATAGPYTVCLHTDSVAGAQQAIRILHRENGVFVDRTSSVDYANHLICATTTSLSPFVLAAATVPCPPVAGGTLTIGKLATPPGDDKLTLGGEVTLVQPVDPPLDPATNGVRLLVTDAADGMVLDVPIAGGAYDPTTKLGWKSASGKWTWKNAGPTDTHGLVKVLVKDLSAKTPGLVQFKVKGKLGAYAVGGANLPVRALVVFTNPTSSTGACATADFATCTLNTAGTLKCAGQLPPTTSTTTSTTSTSTTSTSTLPACTDTGTACGSCGSGGCLAHHDPSAPAAICIDIYTVGSTQCTSDADCPSGQVCIDFFAPGYCGAPCP